MNPICDDMFAQDSFSSLASHAISTLLAVLMNTPDGHIGSRHLAVSVRPFNTFWGVEIRVHRRILKMVFNAWAGFKDDEAVLPFFTGFRKLKSRRLHTVTDLDYDEQSQSIFDDGAAASTATSSNSVPPSCFPGLHGGETTLDID